MAEGFNQTDSEHKKSTVKNWLTEMHQVLTWYCKAKGERVCVEARFKNKNLENRMSFEFSL